LFRKWREAPEVQVNPSAARRTLAVGEKTLLVEWTMQKGAEVPLHDHEHEQIGYVVAGAIDLTIGDDTQRLEPGDGYVAPPGVRHGAVALEDSRVVDVFAPVREDYK
jgi:quercetin dioxygenase-like cupin family protein